jgi:hypothetical protein
MTADRPSRPQLELLSDLQVDREERGTPARPAPAPPVREAPRPQPVLELRVTPLSWSLPRFGLLPAGLTLSGGPVHLALSLQPADLGRALPPQGPRR